MTDNFSLQRTRHVVKQRHLVVTFPIKEFFSIAFIKSVFLHCNELAQLKLDTNQPNITASNFLVRSNFVCWKSSFKHQVSMIVILPPFVEYLGTQVWTKVLVPRYGPRYCTQVVYLGIASRQCTWVWIYIVPWYIINWVNS